MGDIFYNRTVTVYNKTSDDLMGSETWYATVLKECTVNCYQRGECIK